MSIFSLDGSHSGARGSNEFEQKLTQIREKAERDARRSELRERKLKLELEHCWNHTQSLFREVQDRFVKMRKSCRQISGGARSIFQRIHSSDGSAARPNPAPNPDAVVERKEAPSPRHGDGSDTDDDASFQGRHRDQFRPGTPQAALSDSDVDSDAEDTRNSAALTRSIEKVFDKGAAALSQAQKDQEAVWKSTMKTDEAERAHAKRTDSACIISWHFKNADLTDSNNLVNAIDAMPQRHARRPSDVVMQRLGFREMVAFFERAYTEQEKSLSAADSSAGKAAAAAAAEQPVVSAPIAQAAAASRAELPSHARVHSLKLTDESEAIGRDLVMGLLSGQGAATSCSIPRLTYDQSTGRIEIPPGFQVNRIDVYAHRFQLEWMNGILVVTRSLDKSREEVENTNIKNELKQILHFMQCKECGIHHPMYKLAKSATAIRVTSLVEDCLTELRSSWSRGIGKKDEDIEGIAKAICIRVLQVETEHEKMTQRMLRKMCENPYSAKEKAQRMQQRQERWSSHLYRSSSNKAAAAAAAAAVAPSDAARQGTVDELRQKFESLAVVQE